MERPAVLLVDGDADFLTSAARGLAAGGLMVVGWARSVNEVTARTSQLRPDVVVVDLAASDWRQVVDRLRAVDGRGQPIVVALSEHPALRDQALITGAHAVLAKSQFRAAGAMLIRSVWKSARRPERRPDESR